MSFKSICILNEFSDLLSSNLVSVLNVLIFQLNVCNIILISLNYIYVLYSLEGSESYLDFNVKITWVYTFYIISLYSLSHIFS